MAVMHTAEDAEDQVDKGKHAHAQLQLWDSFVEMRPRNESVELGYHLKPYAREQSTAFGQD